MPGLSGYLRGAIRGVYRLLGAVIVFFSIGAAKLTFPACYLLLFLDLAWRVKHFWQPPSFPYLSSKLLSFLSDSFSSWPLGERMKKGWCQSAKLVPTRFQQKLFSVDVSAGKETASSFACLSKSWPGQVAFWHNLEWAKTTRHWQGEKRAFSMRPKPLGSNSGGSGERRAVYHCTTRHQRHDQAVGRFMEHLSEDGIRLPDLCYFGVVFPVRWTKSDVRSTEIPTYTLWEGESIFIRFCLLQTNARQRTYHEINSVPSPPFLSFSTQRALVLCFTEAWRQERKVIALQE